MMIVIIIIIIIIVIIPLAEGCETWVCGRPLAGIAGSNPAGYVDVFILRVLCAVRVSVTGRFLVQRSPTDCIVSECG